MQGYIILDKTGKGIGGTDNPLQVGGSVQVSGTVNLSNPRSAGQNTVTPLGISGVYTSAQFSTAGFGRVIGTVFSDQAGTLVIQQSSDGINYDASTSVNVAASTKTSFSVEVVAPYVQLVYTNGTTAQTVFRLYSFLRGI